MGEFTTVWSHCHCHCLSLREYEDEDMNGGLCFVLASEAAVVGDDKAEAPGEVVKVVMPERVEATVKAVEEVLAELRK